MERERERKRKIKRKRKRKRSRRKEFDSIFGLRQGEGFCVVGWRSVVVSHSTVRCEVQAYVDQCWAA